MIRFGFIAEEHVDDPLKVLEALRHLFKQRFKDTFESFKHDDPCLRD